MSPLRLALEALRWLAGFVLLWSIPRCAEVGTAEPADGGTDLSGVERPAVAERAVVDGVTVVVPARNEEESLPRLLASLPGDVRVIVVDDHSADRTASVAAAAGGTVVPAPPLPDGRNGKAAACAAGAAVATSAGAATVVFLDADCVLEPGGMARLLAEHERSGAGGLLSVQPFHVTVRPYERLSAFFNVVGMMGVGCFAVWRPRPTGAFGPCLVTSSADYERAGGHAVVGAAVLDDVVLARAYAGARLPVRCVGGRGTITFRMYPNGPAQLVEGWTKNFASGATATSAVILVLVVAWLSGCITSGWTLFIAAPRFGVAIYVAYAVQLWWMLRRIGRFGVWPILVFPVPLAFFLGVFLRSVVLTFVVGDVGWKGRRLSVRR